MRGATTAIGLALVLFVGSCGDDSTASDVDAASPSESDAFSDAARVIDAADPTDVGESTDATAAIDTGAMPDTSIEIDATPARDLGAPGDAGPGGARPLGTIGSAASVACGMGAPSTSQCTDVTVTCPGIEPLDALVVVTEPAEGTVSRGTLFAHAGGGGMSLYGGIAPYVAAGLRVVQVRWASAWEQADPPSIAAAACRPATIMRWAFDEVHRADRSTAFCGVGHSGGSGVLAYALAHYGMEEVLDYAALSAGPPFGRLDYGCNAPYDGPPRTLCPELPDAAVALPPATIDRWSGTTTCGESPPSDEDIATWARDSVVSPTGDYDYPRTLVELFDCVTMPNGTTGGAFFYASAITSMRTVRCFTECRGEPLGMAGDMALRDALLAGCVPRHAP